VWFSLWCGLVQCSDLDELVRILQVRVCGLVWRCGLVQCSDVDELVRILQMRVCGLVWRCGLVQCSDLDELVRITAGACVWFSLEVWFSSV
jgi:hypothetical protein